MDALNLAFAVWATASALAVMGLGAASIVGGVSRPRGGLAFGLFAACWGTQIMFGSAASVVPDVAVATSAYLLFLAFFLATPYFLAEVAASHMARSLSAGLVRTLFGASSLAAASILILEPTLLMRGAESAAGRVLPEWGPLYVPLVVVPHFAAFGLALVTLYLAKIRAPTPRIALRVSILLGGLGLYAGYAAGNNLAFYAVSLVKDGAVPDGMVAVFGLLAVLVAALGTRLLTSASRAANLVEGRRDKLLAAALLVPLAWGAIEGFLAVETFPLLNTVGLWRLAGVAVIAYGLARWRVWDLPQRLERGIVKTGGAVTAAAGGAATYGAVQLASTGIAVPAVAALAVAGLSFLPGLRLVERLVKRAPQGGPEDVEAALYGQRIEAYRAALEASLARGTLEEDKDFLAALRERFQISEAEDRLLMHYARSSVLVPRGDATSAYERLRLLGEGGGGRTWLARDRVRDRLVVLKEPVERWQKDPAVRDAVLREARLAARVRHPNVVQVEQVVEHGGYPIIVMEYMDGGTLSDLLRAKGTLPPREAVRIALDVLRGVDAVHAAGIVHRDVKPSNVLLASDGRVCISDFGISMPASSSRTMVEASGTSMAGTWAYMAPEVRHGGFNGDRRADVYSCAAILHECLYGGPPLPDAALVMRDDVPAALAAALARGLSQRPEGRPATARAFVDEITKAVGP